MYKNVCTGFAWLINDNPSSTFLNLIQHFLLEQLCLKLKKNFLS